MRKYRPYFDDPKQAKLYIKNKKYAERELGACNIYNIATRREKGNVEALISRMTARKLYDKAYRIIWQYEGEELLISDMVYDNCSTAIGLYIAEEPELPRVEEILDWPTDERGVETFCEQMMAMVHETEAFRKLLHSKREAQTRVISESGNES